MDEAISAVEASHRHRARRHARQITLFKSPVMALCEIAVAETPYDKAVTAVTGRPSAL